LQSPIRIKKRFILLSSVLFFIVSLIFTNLLAGAKDTSPHKSDRSGYNCSDKVQDQQKTIINRLEDIEEKIELRIN